MIWYHYVAYFFGTLFLVNTIPHWVSGMMGRPFQTPFASPPGEGLSSSTVNVGWAAFNALVGDLLLWHVGKFDLHDFTHAAVAGLAALVGSFYLAGRFGRFNGGSV